MKKLLFCAWIFLSGYSCSHCCLADDGIVLNRIVDITPDIDKELSQVSLVPADVTSARSLASRLKQDWAKRDADAYALLILTLAEKLKSNRVRNMKETSKNSPTAHEVSLNADLMIEAKSIVYDVLIDKTLNISLRSKIFCLQFLSGFSNIDRIDDSRFEELKQFLLVGQHLKNYRDVVAARVPLPPVDLSKYNWSKEVFVSGMPSTMINDPDLRQAYDSALRVQRTNISMMRDKAEVKRLSSAFDIAFEDFAKNFPADSSKDKTLLREALKGYDESVSLSYKTLTSKSIETTGLSSK